MGGIFTDENIARIQKHSLEQQKYVFNWKLAKQRSDCVKVYIR
jgi:hypothetical protein